MIPRPRQKKFHKINVIVEKAADRYPGGRALRKAALLTLEMEGVKKRFTIDILITGNKRIKDLNYRFLGKNSPTDVISFELKDITYPNRISKECLGEVAISCEMAVRQARRFGTSLKEETLLYVIHGVLHLLGYRDKSKRDRRLMEARQKKILERTCAT